MNEHKLKWQSFVEQAPQMPISEIPNGSIAYLDIKDDQPRPGEPDHKFRPVLIFNGTAYENDMNFCRHLVKKLGPNEAPYATYYVPLTTQHHPDQQPLHLGHVRVPWETLAPHVELKKPGFFDPSGAFAIKENELYDLEASDHDLQHVPVLAQLSDQQQTDFDTQAMNQALIMEQVLHPELQNKNRLQREHLHQRYGSHGGENPLVASYRQAHPHTKRFQQPALNRPPQTPLIDDGPDL